MLGALVISLGAAPVAVQSSALVGEGIAGFSPKGYDPKLTPSLCLEKVPQRVGDLPQDWRLTPTFDIEDGKASASLSVPENTSLYGGGEVTGPLLRNGQSIVLWNTDSGAYGVDGGKRLYQSHPWVMGVRPDGTSFGVIFDSSWKATLTTGSERIDFDSEGALFQVYVIDRESPQAVMRGLAEMTGRMPLPPRWALGYQQCRFSYAPESKVREIADTFRAKKIPCDVIWMDIDYMDGYRVFTFHPDGFPEPKKLNRYLNQQGFHSVWMIDPGVKVDPNYDVYRSGAKQDVWTKKPDGGDFTGFVWPGECVFPDYTRPETREWWAGLYKDFMAQGVDGVWNDMNEPAVARELGASTSDTMPDDTHHRGGGALPPGPHLLYHNAYGRLMVEATREGIQAANPDKRPFVLSRANLLGGQRFAATWTGDNFSSREHLELSVPMSLTLGLSGQPFNGPDIGGFLGDASPELWADWIGVGSLFPFARGHACAGTNNKEPWAFGPEVEDAARIAIERRYRLLPYLYTLFENSSRTGLPVMRPVFFADPKDPALRSEEDAFLVGNDLLVVPRWAENPSLPGGVWRDLSLIEGDDGPHQPHLKIRGGAIVPAGKVIQHTGEDSLAPLTLVVCPDENGEASGELYGDEGDGYGYRSGDFGRWRFKARTEGKTVLVSVAKSAGRQALPGEVRVEVVTANGIRRGSGSVTDGIRIGL
ncbi:TIM-barrel domain-containing protein [Haloferula sargassicola]